MKTTVGVHFSNQVVVYEQITQGSSELPFLGVSVDTSVLLLDQLQGRLLIHVLVQWSDQEVAERGLNHSNNYLSQNALL